MHTELTKFYIRPGKEARVHDWMSFLSEHLSEVSLTLPSWEFQFMERSIKLIGISDYLISTAQEKQQLITCFRSKVTTWITW